MQLRNVHTVQLRNVHTWAMYSISVYRGLVLLCARPVIRVFAVVELAAWSGVYGRADSIKPMNGSRANGSDLGLDGVGS